MNKIFYSDILKSIKYKLIKKNFLSFLKVAKNSQKEAEKEFFLFNNFLKKEQSSNLDFKKKIIIKNTKIFIENCIKNNSNIVIKQLLNILKNFSGHTDIQVYANQLDIEIFNSHIKSIINAFSTAEKINFIEDNTLSRGSIIVKSDKSIVDAQVSSQLSSFENCLNKCL